MRSSSSRKPKVNGNDAAKVNAGDEEDSEDASSENVGHRPEPGNKRGYSRRSPNTPTKKLVRKNSHHSIQANRR